MSPRHARQDSSRPPDEGHADAHLGAAVVCPACGHMLSMFTEPEVTAPERIASQMAAFFGSWRFLVLLVVSVVVWVTVNVIWEPIQPHPAMMLTYLGLGLTMLASVQLPLILLSQRQDMRRDRERDREALRVASNTEADLHAIRHSVSNDGQIPGR